MLATFALRLLPVFLLCVTASAISFGMGPLEIPSAFQPMIFIGALVFCIGWMTFKEARYWNLILLVGSAFSVGWIANGLTISAQAPAAPFTITGLMLVLAAISGRSFRVGFAAFGRVIWVGSMIYWAGTILLTWLGLAQLPRDLWAAGGFVLFTGLAASWFASLRREDFESRYVQRAAEMYFLGLNLWLAARLMLNG